MEDLSFDIGQILTDEEADKLFENAPAEETKPADENEVEHEPAEEEEDDTETPERVSEEEPEEKGDAVDPNDDGSSPNSVYSSIAEALKKDGIFPDLSDDDITDVKTPDDFAELFEKAVANRLDERQRRIDEALGNGVAPDTIRMYEQTLQYLGSINEEVLSSEGEDGENLRRQLIYNDLINRGYSQDKALKEIEKSFKAGSDIDDARDALEALNTFYTNGYQKMQDDAKKAAENARELQKKQSEDFRKLVLEDEIKLGESTLDKRTKQRIFDAVTRPVHKDEKTGKLLTAVQKFQMENPLEFLKQLGMWFVLTDGGKNTNGFTKEAVRAEKNKSIRELERKINTTSLKTDGSLKYSSPFGEGSDPLLSDGWKVGW